VEAFQQVMCYLWVERERMIEYCRFYGTGMVNRATPALNIGRIRGTSEVGRGWRGGRTTKGIEAIGSGEMQNTGNETTDFDRLYGIHSPSSRRRFPLSVIHRPGAVYSSEDERPLPRITDRQPFPGLSPYNGLTFPGRNKRTRSQLVSFRGASRIRLASYGALPANNTTS
jgi:hypothetical protein